MQSSRRRIRHGAPRRRALKVLASHPVQYHVPLFRELIAQGMDVDVGYYHYGAAGRVARDEEFGLEFEWDVDLLTGYPHRAFLQSTARYDYAEQARVLGTLLPWALGSRGTPLLLLGWFSEIVWVVWALRVVTRAPTLLLSETTPLSFRARPKPRWRVAVLAWLLQHTSACLFVGERNRRFLESMGVGGSRLFHAPYSIESERFASEAAGLLPRRGEVCRRFGLDEDLPVLLYCGKLIQKKRPLQLLQAYLDAGLRQRAQLVYVGEGALHAEIERRSRDAGAAHVRVLGFFNQTEMPLAYVMGEVLCLISDATETWGLVVNEARACGRPVIVSETVGCGPDLVGEDDGWTVPLDDSAALSEALAQVVGRRQEWTAMGTRGCRRAKTHTYAGMAAGVLSALEAITR